MAQHPILQQEITNGHAARMRYSRFKKQMEGTTSVRRPRNPNSSPRKRVEKKSKKSRSENATREGGLNDQDISPVKSESVGMGTSPGNNDTTLSVTSQPAGHASLHLSVKPEYHNRLTPALTPIHSPQLSHPLTPSFNTTPTTSTPVSTPQSVSAVSSFHSQVPAEPPLFHPDMHLQSMDDLFAAFSMPNASHDQSQSHSQPVPTLYNHNYHTHDHNQLLGQSSGNMLAQYSLQHHETFGMNDLVLPVNFWLQQGNDGILGSSRTSTPAIHGGDVCDQAKVPNSTVAGGTGVTANATVVGGQDIGICTPIEDGNKSQGNVKREEKWDSSYQA